MTSVLLYPLLMSAAEVSVYPHDAPETPRAGPARRAIFWWYRPYRGVA